MNSFFKDLAFSRSLLVLVLPIICQELLNASVNLIDNFMIGQLGEVAITSVGIANQVFFVFSLILFGINSGTAVFVGQYFGKGDFKGIHKVMGLGITLGLVNASIFVFAISFFAEELMTLYSPDPLVIELSVKYLKMIAPSYFCTAFITSINASLKAIRKTSYPMRTTLIALLSNMTLNYIFIFVLNYGVVGAAFGTLCARVIELTAQICIILFKKLPILTKIKNYFTFDVAFVKEYFIICLPVILNEIFWSLGVTICNMAYRFSGTDAQSAVQITGTVQNLFTVMGVAIGGGCGILLSNSLGANELERADEYSKKCLILSTIMSILMGAILIIIRPYIIDIFNVKDVVKEYANNLLLVVAIGISFKTYNYTTIVGILRSGGDTTYTAILDFGAVWLIAIPMAFLGAYYLELPIYITYAMVYSEEIIKAIFTTMRVNKKKWLKSLV